MADTTCVLADSEICARLARWLGMEEIPSSPPRAFARAFDRCLAAGTRAFVREGQRLGLAGGGFWEPTSNLSQAGEVMSEAFRRGWLVIARVEGGAESAPQVRVEVWTPEEDAEIADKWQPARSGEDPTPRLCRVLCLAILEAAGLLTEEAPNA